MQTDSRVRIRYFILSFTTAFFLISAFFFFLVSVVHPRATVVPEPRIVEENEPAWQPGAEDALTVLFLGATSRKEPPGSYLLARFAPEQGKVYLSAIPTDTLVQNQGKTEPLGEVYAYGGASYTRDRLADTLLISIDRYVRIDLESFIAAASAVGTVEYTLPQSMEMDQGGYSFRLEEGLQLLDGKKIGQIFSWDGYKNETEQRDMMEHIAAAIVDQRRDVAASTVVDKLFEKIINLIDSDISYADYAPRKQAGEYLAGLEGPVAEIIPATGEETEDGFLLSDTFSARLAQAYG